MNQNLPLRIVEVIVLAGIVAAFILPVFSSSESEQQQSHHFNFELTEVLI